MNNRHVYPGSIQTSIYRKFTELYRFSSGDVFMDVTVDVHCVGVNHQESWIDDGSKTHNLIHLVLGHITKL